jgi:transposase
MPPAHRAYAEWSPSRFIRWAQKTGPQTARLVQTILEGRAHPEQGYRSCLGILRLEKHYAKERLENAAARALRYSNLSLKALRKILENGLDRLEEKDSATAALPAHDNIRGGQYYPKR